MTQNIATIYNNEQKIKRKAHRKELIKMWTNVIGICAALYVFICLWACI